MKSESELEFGQSAQFPGWIYAAPQVIFSGF
jgi:hypothetical protein